MDNSLSDASIEKPLPEFDNSDMIVEWFEQHLSDAMENPFQGVSFRRLAAARDIVSEGHSVVNELGVNGQGATGLIERFLNDRNLPRDLIEGTLRQEMNSIFAPDANFGRILVQHDEKPNTWQVFLEEAGKGRIPMSQSGSGIKTVLLVLIHLLVIPHLRKQRLSSFLFGFEELENNLHPSIQPRLLLYLRPNGQSRGPSQYSDGFDYLESKGHRSADKVRLAKTVCPQVTKEMLAETLDLGERLNAVCEWIRKSNDMG